MGRSFFRLLAISTIITDGYLALALLACYRLPAEHHSLLPPFGYAFAARTPRIIFIGIILWTFLLAIGILRPGHNDTPLTSTQQL